MNTLKKLVVKTQTNHGRKLISSSRPKVEIKSIKKTKIKIKLKMKSLGSQSGTEESTFTNRRQVIISGIEVTIE